jgi:hypothetical protein
MPGMQRLKEKLAGRPFTLLAVNVRETPSVIWRFRKLVRVDFPLLLDREGRAAEDWGIEVYPSSFLVGPEGKIRYVAYSPRQWDAPEIIEAIEDLLPGKEPWLESVSRRKFKKKKKGVHSTFSRPYGTDPGDTVFFQSTSCISSRQSCRLMIPFGASGG